MDYDENEVLSEKIAFTKKPLENEAANFDKRHGLTEEFFELDVKNSKGDDQVIQIKFKLRNKNNRVQSDCVIGACKISI